MNAESNIVQDKILSRLGIVQLTEMQQAAAEALCEKQGDVVLLSPTGTGKTLAYLLPLVSMLMQAKARCEAQPSSADSSFDGPHALVLTPSRELALQSLAVFRQMDSGLQAMCCYGGHSASEERKMLQDKHPAMIFGTPGRVLDHIRQGALRTGQTHLLVIDEFDKCLELGFCEEMKQIFSHLPKLEKRILLSATDTPEIPSFVGLDRRQPLHRLDFLPSDTARAASRLAVYRVHSPEKDKLETLYRLLCTLQGESTLVFVNYRESVERVAGYLKGKRFPCDSFHGAMEQKDRERALQRFTNGSCPALICTDLAARGLDITHIRHIVHYHLPLTLEAFIHRNGRTARWHSEGAAYLIIGPTEECPPYLQATDSYPLPETVAPPPQPAWTTLYISLGRKDKVSRGDVAGFLYKVGSLTRDDVGTVLVTDRYSFAAVRTSRVKQLLSLVVGEKLKGKRVLIEVAR